MSGTSNSQELHATMRETCRAISERIGEALEGENVGFLLMVFSMGDEDKFTSYGSNAERIDVLTMLEEFLEHELGNHPMAPIFQEIRDERKAQDEQWGGPEHDDKHALYDWRSFIRTQLNDASTVGEFDNRAAQRARMVKIAALAVAAIQSIDRNTEAPASGK